MITYQAVYPIDIINITYHLVGRILRSYFFFHVDLGGTACGDTALAGAPLCRSVDCMNFCGRHHSSGCYSSCCCIYC